MYMYITVYMYMLKMRGVRCFGAETERSLTMSGLHTL